ncbi:universal stress protein [Geomesophilobacter sediminis]|uniref:Universal stress protein n=1 Tax=Geomesophilobacter sediminis TaxID=2798584 RepID=A0A8J7JD61_9BACT|nr:universal stress protein [Geomesophilobacter sediminis]MBJ6724973.1 universal stress protein [Geomesophilobacter sediminis]
MFKHILVPIDGSVMAEAALPAAAFLAQKLAARVTLMHVIEKNAPTEVHGQRHLQHPEDAESYLRELAARSFPAEVPVDIHVHSTEVDDVAASIVAHADELKHDLVIMCSHGKGAAVHLFLGSIAQSVIALDSRPVLITHPTPDGSLPRFSCRHVLVPLDEDPEHAHALPVSKAIARACGATLHLLMVIPDLATLSGDIAVASKMLPGTTSRLLELSREDAEHYFEGLENELRQEGFQSSAHVLRGDPATVIVEAAERTEIDLVVVGTHGKTGMDALWSGSVAHRICSQSRVPLLLLRVGKG